MFGQDAAQEVLLLAPEFSLQLLALQPDLARFILARRRRTRLYTPDAEDELQEVLTEILRSGPHYREELGEFRPWAFGIAINVHRRFARLQRRQDDCFYELPPNADALEAHDPSPERWAQIQQARARIEYIHRGMPPKQYVALYLLAVEGYSHAEIAIEMGISEASSKQLVHRAREYLAQNGINEKTFFSAPPLSVEPSNTTQVPLSFWQKHYDWVFRVGNAVSLLAALAFTSPVKPIEFARAWFATHRLPEIALAHGTNAPRPHEPAHLAESTRETGATSELQVLPTPRHESDKPVRATPNSKSHHLTLMVRKNPKASR